MSAGTGKHSDSAYKELEEKIVTLQIGAGQMVTEQELCTISGFGRTPVREAVQKLERDLIVSVIPRRGVLIEPVDAQRALMTLDVRRRLEPFLTARAVQYAEEVQKWRFRDLSERMQATAETGDTFEFMRLDRELNGQVAQAARHDIACKMVFPLHAISRRIGYLFAIKKGRGPGEAVATHSALAEAIAAGDEAAAMAALETTFDTSAHTALQVEAMIKRGEIRPDVALSQSA
ncbi:GntR family transcriptional regulator [Jannaschia sp. M317]|uniref:GntR family transcriptional regulator n=1 Tax=Jannaschia sp. M317 TaxID=2867011 RepID=UPI0021A7FA8B|nr:GntR family transcriptional regulator [Jannaschia sp. M317]UWQ17905.1 GntR family transcriptional regulator [Jannaschia sp. M317]